MASDDKYTGLDGTQIRDGSLTPTEMNTVNDPSKLMMLTYPLLF